MQAQYQTIVLNDQGLVGDVKINNGPDFVTGSPHNDADKNNPEQLIGAALATCLNATLEYIRRRDELATTSSVTVTVDQYLDVKGYKFYIDAKVTIPDMSHVRAQEMLDEAETRCPVAKLLSNDNNVKVHL